MEPAEDLPKEAKVWVFPVISELSDAGLAHVSNALEQFVDSWNAHRVPVRGGFMIVRGRFIVVFADEAACVVGGCSTDSLFRAVSKMLAEIGLTVSDFADVHYLDQNKVVSCSRETFQELLSRGELSKETIVFDTTVASVEDLRNSFQVPVTATWHGKFFDIPTRNLV